MRNKNGQFTAGHNYSTGRPKGSKNKTTQKIRDTYLKFIEANLDRMQADFDELEAKDRFKYLFEMSKFILPSLKAVEFGNILDELTEDEFNEIITRLKNEFSPN